MKQKDKSQISVTFYLKKISSKNQKAKAVYATIAYRGTSSKVATGIRCEDPQKDWIKNAFSGSQFGKLNSKLEEIKSEIEGYDSSIFRNATEIKNAYNVEDFKDFPSTILNALEYAYLQKKKKVKPTTLVQLRSNISLLEDYILIKRQTDYGIVQSHPKKLTKLIVKDYYEWLLSTRKLSSANNAILQLKSLFKVYYDDHIDSVPDIIVNPFISVITRNNKQKTIAQALAKNLDWKHIEKIEKISYLNSEISCHGCRKNAISYEKYRLVTLFLAHTGMSFIELGKADVLDISKTLHGSVLSSRRVKTNKKYTIPVSPKVKEIIEELGTIPWDPFVDENGNYSHNQRQKIYAKYCRFLKKLAEDIELRSVLTPHILRHTFAMRMLNYFNYSLKVVARMLGDTEQTARENYCDYDDDNIVATMNQEMTNYMTKSGNKSESQII